MIPIEPTRSIPRPPELSAAIVAGVPLAPRAARYQAVDFPEGGPDTRLAPGGTRLHGFIDLNDMAPGRFSGQERAALREGRA